MDIATIVGLLLAFGALLIATLMEGGEIVAFINIPAFVIVMGGSLGATVISIPLRQIMGIMKVTRRAFFAQDMDKPRLLNTIVEFARRARREGILALEEESKQVDNPFLRKAVQLVVDGNPGELVREVLETEVGAMEERHKAGESIYSTLGGFAPTLGILGTVMGLVHMLASLDEPGRMGEAIAAAFIATLYGVGSANVIFLPIGNKLKARSQEEIAVYEMMIEGILSLLAGDNPRVVSAKMEPCLSPAERETLEALRSGAGSETVRGAEMAGAPVGSEA